MGTAIVGAIVLCCCIGAIKTIISNKRNGKGCGCGCSGCTRCKH